MSDIKFQGNIPALLTPFTQDGEVDEPKLRAFIDYLAPQVGGLFACGSYASGPLFSDKQRLQVMEIVAEQVGGRVPVILHVGHPSTDVTIEMAKAADGLGFDGISSLPPYYYHHSDQSVSDHFLRLIDAVETPVYVYNNPSLSNNTVSPSQLAELAERGLAGVKDSSANIKNFYDFIDAVDKPGFGFIIGSQTLILPALQAGGHGCVSGVGNLYPKFIKAIFDAYAAGDNERALDLQFEANEMRAVCGAGIPIPFYHAALKLNGIDIGYPKAPLMMPDDAEIERIKRDTAVYAEWN
jgi:dihydrodipicolinate synthase/N-acetylneuraminate lyase